MMKATKQLGDGHKTIKLKRIKNFVYVHVNAFFLSLTPSKRIHTNVSCIIKRVTMEAGRSVVFFFIIVVVRFVCSVS